MNKSWIILALFPLLAISQGNEEAGAELAALSWDQLCEQRGNPAAWQELERRELFTRRELRAIEDERLRAGLRQEAIICFLGEPEDVVPLNTNPGRDYAEAFTYPLEGPETLIVQIRHREDESTVVRFYEIEDEAVSRDLRYFGSRCTFGATVTGFSNTRRCGYSVNTNAFGISDYTSSNGFNRPQDYQGEPL
jgi:hypothetical protein